MCSVRVFIFLTSLNITLINVFIYLMKYYHENNMTRPAAWQTYTAGSQYSCI